MTSFRSAFLIVGCICVVVGFMYSYNYRLTKYALEHDLSPAKYIGAGIVMLIVALALIGGISAIYFYWKGT